MAIGRLGLARSMASRLLTDTCTVMRPGAPVSDGAGGYTKGSPSTVGTYACRVSMMARFRPEEVQQAGELRGVLTYDVHFPTAADVRAQDRIAVQSSGDALEVIGGSPNATDAALRTVLARRTQ